MELDPSQVALGVLYLTGAVLCGGGFFLKSDGSPGCFWEFLSAVGILVFSYLFVSHIAEIIGSLCAK